MRIQVDRIPNEGLFIKIGESVDVFPALKALAQEEGIQFHSPILMDLRVRRISHFVEAEGSLQTSVHLKCSRCLGEYIHELTTQLAATYTDEPPVTDADEEDADIEITSESVELFHFKGKEIDLNEAVSEQIILSLPLRPLCREECKGLCPKCGADLNKESCRCAKKEEDFRFSALKNLKIQ